MSTEPPATYSFTPISLPNLQTHLQRYYLLLPSSLLWRKSPLQSEAKTPTVAMDPHPFLGIQDEVTTPKSLAPAHSSPLNSRLVIQLPICHLLSSFSRVRQNDRTPLSHKPLPLPLLAIHSDVILSSSFSDQLALPSNLLASPISPAMFLPPPSLV